MFNKKVMTIPEYLKSEREKLSVSKRSVDYHKYMKVIAMIGLVGINTAHAVSSNAGFYGTKMIGDYLITDHPLLEVMMYFMWETAVNTSGITGFPH